MGTITISTDSDSAPFLFAECARFVLSNGRPTLGQTVAGYKLFPRDITPLTLAHSPITTIRPSSRICLMIFSFCGGFTAHPTSFGLSMTCQNHEQLLLLGQTVMGTVEVATDTCSIVEDFQHYSNCTKIPFYGTAGRSKLSIG